MTSKVEEVYAVFKNKYNLKYNEEYHCKLLIKIMMDKEKGCHTYFCVEAMIGESTFYNWINTYEIFCNVHSFCKMVSKKIWYEEGIAIKGKEYQIGTMNYEMDHWKLMGWAKFGISRNARIRIDVNHADSPAQHYAAILKQASDGAFTASEFKQLMEAVNVGLNVHQTFELQKQINELKSDISIMAANNGTDNPFANKGAKKTD